MNFLKRFGVEGWLRYISGLEKRLLRPPPYAPFACLAVGMCFAAPLAAQVTPPSITSQPISQTANASQTVIMSVMAQGSQPLIYQWRKAGTNLIDDANVIGSQSSRLTLVNVLAETVGAYAVCVTNSVGTAISSNALLSVRDPVILTQPQSVGVNSGTAAMFTVVAAGTPPLSYQWNKNGIPLLDGDNVSGATSSALTISGASSSDEASYSVVVSCPAGSVTNSGAIPQATGFFVAPRSTPGGDGTRQNPWDLQTALAQPSEVTPGSTIWLRGGIHRLNNRMTKFVSRLQGTPDRPITVRQYPGERAIIDGNILQMVGGWVNYRGFEIMSSLPERMSWQNGPFPTTWTYNYDGVMVDLCVSGFDLQAPNVKLINLVIRDSIGGGIGLNRAAQNSEIYGCLAYYNGWQAPDRAHGHGLYGQNAAPWVKTVRDNLFFANLALGLQATGNGPDPVADNFVLDGNAFFMNGTLSWQHQGNLLVGAAQGPSYGALLTTNLVYDTAMNTYSDVNVGYGGGLISPAVHCNYFATRTLFSPANQGMSVRNNVFAGNISEFAPSDYPENVYLSTKPTTNSVFIRANRYEKGRANVIIFNWEKRDVVQIDLSGIGLVIGQEFEIRNAADYFSDVILRSFDGNPVDVPMTGHTVSRPVGQNFSTPASTFPEFGAFVITPRHEELPFSAPVMLTINQPPTNIGIQPQFNTVGAGSNVVFTASSEGTPPFSYQWMRGDSPLNDGLAVSGATSSSVTLSGVQISDSGSYSVIVTNVAGTQTGPTAILTVIEPPTVTASPVSTTAAFGTAVEFSASATGVVSTIQWKKNNVTIPGATNSNFRVLPVSGSDAGTYTVVFHNAAGAATSSPAILTVLDPIITLDPQPGTSILGSNAVFHVTASGTPPLKYQWFSAADNGLTCTKLTGQTTSTLSVNNLTASSARGYFVTVSNVFSKPALRSTVAQLTVYTPPIITAQPAASIQAVAGTKAEFYVKATGSSPLFYQWFHNGNLIDEATSSRLSLSNLQPDFAGIYSCAISNVSGLTAISTNTRGRLIVLPDTYRPAVIISFPGAAVRFTNNVTKVPDPEGGMLTAPEFVMSGLATDNGLVSTVTVERVFPPGAPAVQATLTGDSPGRKEWRTRLTLVDGTNTFRVVAFDSTGAVSTPVVRSFFLVTYSRLSVRTSGWPGCGWTTNVGSAFGMARNGSLLEIGRGYSIKAIAGKNFVFTNWTDNAGTVLGNDGILKFLMRSNLELTANFLTNPIIPALGRYDGLFYPTNIDGAGEIDWMDSGCLSSLTVRADRSFSGKLWFQGFGYGVSGKFDMSGHLVNKLVARPLQGSPLNLNMWLDWGSPRITGTVSCSSPTNTFLAQLTANLGTNHATAGRACFIIPPGESSASPPGYGHAFLTRTESGMISLSGSLADGTVFGTSLPVANTGTWPFYLNLYTGHGLLEGWLFLSNGVPIGTLTWIRPGSAGSLFGIGFTNTAPVWGSTFVIRPSDQPALTQTNLFVEITPPDGHELKWKVQLTRANSFRVLGAGSATNLMTGSINRYNGKLTISFRPTASGPILVNATGAVLQNTSIGYGSFITPQGAGVLRLYPQPQ